jgi:hypothetical protein
VVGALMSFDYHNRSMQIASPVRWQAFDARMYELTERVGLALGQVEGPQVFKLRLRPQPIGRVETFWKSADPRANDRVLLEHIGDQLIRFGHRRGGEPIEWGRPLKWEPNHTHTVSVQMPSLYSGYGDGWWDGVQQRMAFRRKTSVAVWFSGGRALGRIVPPLPKDLTPGGGIDAEFTGEIRDQFTRVYQFDEVESGLADEHAKRGGPLRLRVLFPEVLQEKGEPIFAVGAHYRSSIIFVETAAGGIRFVFENYGTNRVESPVFRPDPRGHLVELETPSFHHDPYGEEATGDVVIRLDGQELLRTRQVTYPSPPGAEQIGRNGFGTTCAAEFRGWIYEARWMPPERRAETQR